MKVHLCGRMYQYFIPFNDQIVFHCLDEPHFVYPFISLWIFELFPLFSARQMTLPWMLISLESMVRSGIAGSYLTPYLTVWETVRSVTFSLAVDDGYWFFDCLRNHQICYILSCRWWLLLFHILTNTYYFPLFGLHHHSE